MTRIARSSLPIAQPGFPYKKLIGRHWLHPGMWFLWLSVVVTRIGCLLLIEDESSNGARVLSVEPPRAATRQRTPGIFDHMVELSLRQGQQDQAFLWSERGRASSTVELWSELPEVTTRVASVGKLTDQLEMQTTLLKFSFVGERIVCWVFEKGKRRFVELETNVGELKEIAEAFLRSLRCYEHAGTLEGATQLYGALLAPLSLDLETTQRLIFVPPIQLISLPFSALFDSRSNSFLIERVAVATAPSATLYRLADERSRAMDRTDLKPLVVGDPEIRGVHALPYAADEAKKITALVDGSHSLLGAEATPSNVLELLPAYTAFHFSGHGTTSAHDPSAAALLLTPEGPGDGLLQLDDIFLNILNEKLTHLQLVVLSACETLVGSEAGQDGPLGLAQAFFVAGVPRVVGTLWSVEDRAAAELMIAFYRHLKNHRDVAEALRQATLEQMNRGGPSSEPAYWAAFSVIGG